MSLQNTITQDLKSAMMAKDTLRLSTLRMLITAMRNEQIAHMKKDVEMTDEETIAMISREVKKRKDSIDQFTAANRADLAKQEKKELEILQVYLPAQMSEDEVRKIVEETIKECGATSAKDLGMVMKALIPKTKGKADGGMVSRIVKEKLGT